MFIYEKKLQYPVKIANCNPKLASFIISQYGGPDGELGASMRYLSQRYAMPYPEISALLTDIGTVGAQWLRNWSPGRGRMSIRPFARAAKQSDGPLQSGTRLPAYPHPFHFLTSPPPHDRLPHVIRRMAPRRQRGL